MVPSTENDLPKQTPAETSLLTDRSQSTTISEQRSAPPACAFAPAPSSQRTPFGTGRRVSNSSIIQPLITRSRSFSGRYMWNVLTGRRSVDRRGRARLAGVGQLGLAGVRGQAGLVFGAGRLGPAGGCRPRLAARRRAGFPRCGGAGVA